MTIDKTSETEKPDVWGVECSCQGLNPNCLRCDGWGRIRSERDNRDELTKRLATYLPFGRGAKKEHGAQNQSTRLTQKEVNKTDLDRSKQPAAKDIANVPAKTALRRTPEQPKAPTNRPRLKSEKPKATKFHHRKLPKDVSRIIRTRFKKATEGDAVEQFLLGRNYEMGDGVEDHYIEAAGWYRESAVQGHPEAQFRLGLLLKSGLGVTKNLALAKEYVQSALSSEHNFSEAERLQIAELLGLET